MDKADLFGFCDVFGFYIVRVLRRVRVQVRSVCTVDFVEKMCKNLWGSWWESGGKKLEILWKSKFYTKNVNDLHLKLGGSGKIYQGFTHRNNRGMGGVLHIFHIVYYNYYLI